MIHPLFSRGGRNDAYVVMESVKFRGQTGVGRSDEQSESRMWRELKNAEHSACLKHRPGASDSYRNALLREIRAIFSFAVRRGWCMATPARFCSDADRREGSLFTRGVGFPA